VLIFERLREEQQRGLSLRMAVRNAYDRAFSAIVDSNATTVCTSLFLYWFGSEEVKGFGLTLLIGLISSLFTALYVTKTIFGLLIDYGHIHDLGSLPRTFPKWDQLLRPNIDWMKLNPIFWGISIVLICVGCTAFVVKIHQREMADIEFASGTSIQIELKDAMPIEQVRHRLTAPAIAHDLPSPTIYAIGSNSREYQIDTPSNNPAVKSAVLKAMGDTLKIDLPSTFKGVGQGIEDVLNTTVLPITSANLSVDGFTPPMLSSYMGGAAIVLRDLNPPLKPSDIAQRIEGQRLQQNKDASGYRDYAVLGPGGPDKATDVAVVLTADPNLPYDKDQFKWRDSVAAPMWKLINDAVNKPASLQKVTTFNPQVAGDAQSDALLALTLSLVAIMAYIWLRFGNLKYGTATVVAMIHDTLLVIGFMGLAHWIVQFAPEVAKVLMIEPFRINLTIVAAVLTVMSYSMIDTIVVFDRVRENRGKFGHLSRTIINDSINQTLSRTLLTGGTNIATVFIMYVLGGPGIHGFTFVLLTGILVGTYSSVAIAAPILLFGEQKETSESKKQAPVGQLQRA
jgi:SecD/SecF fusion protein